RSGVTPLAIANAIASGSATMPTITPAPTSARSWARVYPRNVVNSFGAKVVGEAKAELCAELRFNVVRDYLTPLDPGGTPYATFDRRGPHAVPWAAECGRGR